MDDFKIYEDVIGRGKHSVVYKGRKKQSLEYFAIKSVDKLDKNKVFNEVKMLNFLKQHENVIRFYNWYETNNHYWVIMEYCSGGDVVSIIQQDQQLPEETVHDFGLDILRGLQYMHSKGIIHGDLKPKNILIDGYGVLKFGDFGAAQLAKERTDPIVVPPPTNIVVPKGASAAYLSPEVLVGAPQTVSSDLWSFGCLLYELAAGVTPFHDATNEAMAQRIVFSDFEPLQNGSPEFNDLLKGLLNKNPAERLTWEKLRTHIFWKEKIAECQDSKFLHPVFHVPASTQHNNENSPLTKKNAPSPLTKSMSIAEKKNQKKEPATTDEEYTQQSLSEEQIQNLLFHQSDSFVKPIAHNPTIESIPKAKYEPESLPFEALSVETLLAKHHNNQSELEGFLVEVFKHLASKKTPAPQKLQILSYFETLCVEDQLVNILINSDSIITKFLDLLTKFKSSALRCRILQVLGLMFMHSTYISPKISNTGIFQVFIGLINEQQQPTSTTPTPTTPSLASKTAKTADKSKDKDKEKDKDKKTDAADANKIKRRALGCLGELLFYTATQANEPSAEQWEIPHEAVVAVKTSLKDSDEIIQHYAAKTIENIVEFNKTLTLEFSEADTVFSFLAIIQKTENAVLKSCAISSLARICKHKKDIAVQLFEKQPKQLLTLLSDENKRVQQSTLNILNMLFFRHPNSVVSLELLKDAQFNNTLLSIIKSNTSPTLRAKSLMTICLITKNAFGSANSDNKGQGFFFKCLFVLCSTGGLCAALEKINTINTTKKDPYITKCFNALLNAFSEMLPFLTKQSFQDLSKDSKIMIQQISKTRPATNLELITFLVTTPCILQKVVNETFINSFAECSSFRDDVMELEEVGKKLVCIMEAISHYPVVLRQNTKSMIDKLFPILLQWMRSEIGDLRFMSVKILTDMLNTLLRDSTLYDCDDPKFGVTSLLNQLVRERVLPMQTELQADEEPIAVLATQLFDTVFECTSLTK